MRVIFLVLFVTSAGSSIWGSIDVIFYTPELFDVAQDYDLTYPYYILLGFFFWGGLAVCYTLLRRNEWGYGFGLIWIWANIVFVTLIAIVAVLDTTFIFRYLIASTPAAERDIASIAEIVGSGIFTVGMVVFCLGSAFFGFVFLWLLIKNRDYFSNTSSI